MKVVVQKVTRAKCTVNGKVSGEIEKGFLLLVGFKTTDTISEVKKLAKKIQGLRIFEDEADKMNLSIHDVKGSILSISQFTLYGNLSHGFRPGFVDAMKGELAKPLYDAFNEELRSYDIIVKEGIFGAHMYLDFINDGPTTIILDSNDL